MKLPLIKNFEYDKKKTSNFITSVLEKIGVGSMLVALFPASVGSGVALYAFGLATICFAVEFLLVNSKE